MSVSPLSLVNVSTLTIIAIIAIRLYGTSPHMIHPCRGKLLHAPAFAQRQRLEWDHVVLVLRRIVRGSGVSARVYHAQRRDPGRR